MSTATKQESSLTHQLLDRIISLYSFIALFSQAFIEYLLCARKHDRIYEYKTDMETVPWKMRQILGQTKMWTKT